MLNAEQPSVWAPADAVREWRPLDAEAMNRAARQLIGTHNFKSFKCPGTHVSDDVCNARFAQVSRQGELVIFDVVANRFLYKMVRNLMGQLVAIGRHNQNPDTILNVLDQQDRRAAAPAAHPNGLCLMAVNYPASYNYFSRDPHVRILNQIVTLDSEMESETNVSSYENLLRKAS